MCPICEGAFEVAALWEADRSCDTAQESVDNMENSDPVYVCTDEGAPGYSTVRMDASRQQFKRIGSSSTSTAFFEEDLSECTDSDFACLDEYSQYSVHRKIC